MEINHLSDCEELIMKTIWDAEQELSLTDIMQRVNDTFHKEWKAQTVSTFLTRLVKKGYLQRYRNGRLFFYQVLVPQEAYVGEMAGRFVEFWNQGNVEGFLAALETKRP